MVGVRKAIWKNEQTLRNAEIILMQECGSRHQVGEHSLCPKCKRERERLKLEEVER
jgi:hypothetical protein